jgi:hypothetical protein
VSRANWGRIIGAPVLPSGHQRRLHSWSNWGVKRGGLVMRTTAFFAVMPRLPNWQSNLNPANKWFRSLSWERAVFSLLAEVEGLPLNVKGEIATRVGKYINFARTARDDATLTHFIEAAAGEREKVAHEARSAANPLWAAAALAEAWCVTRLGLSNSTLNRYSAMSVSTAIETFASERAA